MKLNRILIAPIVALIALLFSSCENRSDVGGIPDPAARGGNGTGGMMPPGANPTGELVSYGGPGPSGGFIPASMPINGAAAGMSPRPSGGGMFTPGTMFDAYGRPMGRHSGGLSVQQGEVKTRARGQSMRMEEWTDPVTGQRIKKQSIVQNGAPPRMKGKRIDTQPSDAFVNGPNGEQVNIPAGAEVPDSVMQEIFRKQQGR